MLGRVRVFKFGLEVKFNCGLGDASVAQDHAQALTISGSTDGFRRRADHRTISTYQTKQKIYPQGDPADAVFYVQQGKVKVCIISELGRKRSLPYTTRATFFGEGCLNGQPLRLATVEAIEARCP